METESGLYFGKGTEKFRYVFTFRFRNYFSGANVPLEIISLNALVEMEIFAEINFSSRTNPPGAKTSQSKIVVFHFLKLFMVSQVHNLLIVQWLPV